MCYLPNYRGHLFTYLCASLRLRFAKSSGRNIFIFIDFILLGISVSGISFPSRSVTLKGFNNLKNGVQIQTFDLPSNDPAGGIHLTLEATAINVTEPFIFMFSSIIHA